VADRLEHLLAQQGGKLRCPLGSTRGAEAAPTAAARHEVATWLLGFPHFT